MISVVLGTTLRIITNSASNVFQKNLTNIGEHPAKINFINYILMSLFSIPILLINNFLDFTFEFWTFAILGGITGAICNFFMALALRQGQLSVLGPINSYKSVIGLIFGIILLQEYPSIYGLAGIVLIIFGTYFIFDKPSDFFKKDILYRFYALFFSAIEAVFIKKVIILSSISVSFAVSSIFGAIFSFLIIKIFVPEQTKLSIEQSQIKQYTLMALCFGSMTFLTAFVFKLINVSYALALFQLSVVLNVILGYKLFREKNLLKKLAGSFIILLGSTMIILFGN